MTRAEAIKAMIEGKQVHYNGNNIPVYFDQQRGAFYLAKARVNPNDLLTEGWEIYEPPKPKVKMWQWVYMDRDRPATTYHFYQTEEEAVKDLIPDHVLQKADWTEIEVEV